MNSDKWLNCRLYDLRERLVSLGHGVSIPVISRLLKAHNYRLRVNRKALEGAAHPERDRQFEYIQEERAWHEDAGQPCLSIDTKKKELIGNFKNAGQVWCQEPVTVNSHDFPQDALGRAVPYGIYDLHHNQADVYVGQSADTPTFAVDNLVRWCQTELAQRFPVTTQSESVARWAIEKCDRHAIFENVVDTVMTNWLPSTVLGSFQLTDWKAQQSQ